MTKRFLMILVMVLWGNVGFAEGIKFFKCEIIKDRIDHSKLTKREEHPFKKGYKFDLKIDMDGQVFYINEILFYMYMIYPDRINGYQVGYTGKLFIELDRYGGNIKITDVEAKPKKTLVNFKMQCGQKSKIF